MTALDLHVLAERVSAVERHLTRVGARLPPSAAALQPATDASDAVVLHLWQAVQIVIDLSVCPGRLEAPVATSRTGARRAVCTL